MCVRPSHYTYTLAAFAIHFSLCLTLRIRRRGVISHMGTSELARVWASTTRQEKDSPAAVSGGIAVCAHGEPDKKIGKRWALIGV